MNIKKFDILAINANIVYNKYGDHDPNGLMFVRAEDEEAILCGEIEPKPLILRANAGDLIEVKLTNIYLKKCRNLNFRKFQFKQIIRHQIECRFMLIY